MWQYTSILILLKSPVHPLPLEIKLACDSNGKNRTYPVWFVQWIGKSEFHNFCKNTIFFWGGGIKYPLKFGETSLFEKKAPVNIC